MIRLGVFLHPALSHEGLIYSIDNMHAHVKQKRKKKSKCTQTIKRERENLVL